MAAACQIHCKYSIAYVQYGIIYGHIGGRPRMRMYVDMFGSKKFLRSFYRQFLYNANIFAAAVPPCARIAFGIFIGHGRALCLEDAYVCKVLARYEFDISILPFRLIHYRFINFGVYFLKLVEHFYPLIFFSMALICSTLFKWRPPSKGVESHMSKIFLAFPM